MKDFIQHFVREADGTWECVSNAELDAPGGRIEVCAGSRFVPGTRFMGVDLAKWLEEQHQKDKLG